MPNRQPHRGQILPLVALMMTALLLVLALVIDGGFAWTQRRVAQNGADLAALAGARVVAQAASGGSRTDGDVRSVIASVGTANGAQITFGAPAGPVYTDGNGVDLAGPVYVGGGSLPSGARGVRVSAVRHFRPFLLGLIGVDSLDAAADAVARTTTGARAPCAFCVIGTAPTFTMKSGSTRLSVIGGAIGSNSGLGCSANATLSSTGMGAGMNVYGSYSAGNCSVTPARTSLTSPIPDPLAFLPNPVATGPNFGAVKSKGPNTTTTIGPGIFASLSVEANATVRMDPGTYYFTGDVQIESSAWLIGSGVTLVFMGNANFKPKSGTANVQLSAPPATSTTATYPGMLMYFDRRGTHTIQTQASSTSFLRGTIYGAPNPADPLHTGTFLDMESNASVASMDALFIVTSAAINSGADLTVTYDPANNLQIPGGPPSLVR